MTMFIPGRYMYRITCYRRPSDPEPVEIMEETIGGVSDELRGVAWRQAASHAAANRYERVDVQFAHRDSMLMQQMLRGGGE